MLSKNTTSHFDRFFCFVLAPLFFNEASGYRLTELPFGNPACALDPACHRLTDDQIAFARETFGDAIDYDSVMIFDRPKYYFLNSHAAASASNGNIYNTSGIITQAGPDGDFWGSYVFIHEMTHVWQEQSRSFIASLLWRYNSTMSYKYDITAHENFSAYGPEQQAEITANSYTQRYNLTHPLKIAAEIKLETGQDVSIPSLIRGACANLARTEEKTRQAFPARPLPARCTPPAP